MIDPNVQQKEKKQNNIVDNATVLSELLQFDTIDIR
jgi:hypothetical protein